MRRWVERIVWGGEFRERVLSAAVRGYFESLFRRQWTLRGRDEFPHFFDHRIEAVRVALGGEAPNAWARAFYAAEILREEDRILDIGCGDGFFDHRFFRPKCAHVDGIDVEPTAIEHATRHHSAATISYHLLDAVNDPFPHATYDVIVWDGALGHFPPATTTRMLEKIAAALDPGGVFVGSESLGWEGHDHLQFFHSLEELAELFLRSYSYVDLRESGYALPNGSSQKEAFWRCGQDDSRLAAAGWTRYVDEGRPAPV